MFLPRTLFPTSLTPVLLVCPAGAALNTSELQLVWYDEFMGDAVDSDKWVLEEGDGCDVNLCNWGNAEKQWYRGENAEVLDGALAITAREEVFSSREFTSAKLSTRNKFAFRYGRVEARLRLPSAAQGLWPAFWMMPEDNVYGKWAASGEIDIMESRNNMTEIFGNLNFGNAFPNNSNYDNECVALVDPEFHKEYHTFTLDWDDEEMVWFVDGQPVCRHDHWFSTDVKTGQPRPMPAPFDQDFHLVLNVAVGGKFAGGTVDALSLPSTMSVDWVRVFQTPEHWQVGGGDMGEREGVAK
ncbi:unnamed protein product, partial [Discosporangium mesarthrocarpum]